MIIKNQSKTGASDFELINGKFLRNAKCGELGQKKVYVISSSIFEQEAETTD